jgi:phosphatidate cytidylyltransferase
MTDVDDVPEGREDDVSSLAPPATRPETTGPASDRVRIVGAETAGEITSELPVVGAEPDVVADPDAGAEPASGTEPGVGAGPFADAPGDFATEPEGYGLTQPMVRVTDEPAEPAGAGPAVDPVTPGQTAVPATGTTTELPHWTEPPTGQVPAVLARDTGDQDGSPGVAAPTWREEDADWVAHDDQFEPAMFGSDQVALGSLDESDRSNTERRPWEFDLDSVKPGSPSPSRRSVSDPAPAESTAADPITEETEVVAPHGHDPLPAPAQPEPVKDAPPAAETAQGGSGRSDSTVQLGRIEPQAGEEVTIIGAAVGGLSSEGSEPPTAAGEENAEKRRPSGSTRHGRPRRNGLRPGRLRAKKPDEVGVPDSPLAAEPPGASVTEVPGAGRRRGLAGLAAADRTAERKDTDQAEVEPEAGQRRSRSAVAAVGVAAGATRRRLTRRPTGADPVPAGEVTTREPTGGGPPPPRRPRRGEGTASSGRREETSSIGVRVGTGVAVAVVALLAFKVGTVAALALCVVVVTFAAGECFGVLRRAGYHPASLLGLVGTVSLMIGAYTKGVAALPLVLVLLTVFTFIWYLLGIERGSPVAGTAATLLTVGWVSLLGSYAGLLLAPSAFPNRHGIAFLLGAVIATVANDIGALAIGGWLGSRPLAPNISPNKTWEGLFGGAVFSILVSTVVVGSIHPWSASNAALLGVVVAVVAPLGDLCESLLKRDLGLKDMGSLLPGHGGLLDRVDALLFVLPATYYLVRALNIA